MGEWWRRTAVEIAAAVAAGEVSAEEVMADHLARADEVGAATNALAVRLDDEAMAAARAADAARAAGRRLGPLHGVPVTIKENVDQKGCATTNGVAAFADVVAAEDSPPVANLRKAGAIPFARTNTPEFSLRYITDNPLRGLTLNPWKKEITPGGSSGGAAAACATGLGAIAHGNDLGGSIRYPAWCCGLVGVRPTLGRVPAFNPTQAEERPPTVQLMSVQGPLTRTVADARLALAAMAGRDVRDPWWVPAPLQAAAPHDPPRAALARDPAGLGVAPEAAAAVARAGEALAAAGYRVVEVELADAMETATLWLVLLMAEVDELMAPAIREHGSARINRVIDHYRAGAELIYDGRRPGGDGPGAHMRNLAQRAGALRRWSLLLEEAGVVVGPVSCAPPLRQHADEEGPGRAAEMFTANRLTCSVNLLGLPSVAVPTGVRDGVPGGVQIVAPRYREDLALAAAEAVEARCGLALPIDPQW